MNVQDIDAIVVAGGAWVEQHHRTRLTGAERTRIRTVLRRRLDEPFKAAPDLRELVELAHREATRIVDSRRDGAQRMEHARQVRP